MFIGHMKKSISKQIIGDKTAGLNCWTGYTIDSN